MTKKSPSEEMKYSYRSLVFRAAEIKTAIKKARDRKKLRIDARKNLYIRLVKITNELNGE